MRIWLLSQPLSLARPAVTTLMFPNLKNETEGLCAVASESPTQGNRV